MEDILPLQSRRTISYEERYYLLFHSPRLIDRITDAMLKCGLIVADGHYPVISEVTDKEVAHLICVRGNGLVVRFWDWVTQYRGKDYREVEVEYI